MFCVKLRAGSAEIIARIERSPLAASSKHEVLEAYRLRDLRRAEKLLVESIDQAPNSPELLAVAAMLFLADEQPMNAAIALKKSGALRPLSPDDRFRLCMAYISLKRGDWARPELQSLAAQDPENASYLYWLARLDYDDRKYDDGAARLQQAIHLQPEFARAYDNLGLNLEALGKADEAAAAYRTAMLQNRRQPERSFWPPLNAGALFLQMGKLDDARAALNEAAALNPRSAQVHYRLGKLHAEEAHTAEAVAEFTRATELDKSYPDPWWALARVLRRDGRSKEADKATAEFQRLKYGSLTPGQPQ